MSPKVKDPDPAGVTESATEGQSFGDIGSAEVLPIDQLNVDMAYQRELRRDLVNQIAKDYDVVKAGPILVSERPDGSLWVVDGQHRMAGAQQAGEAEVFAHVVHGLTQEQEADLRLARNERRSDTIFEKFRTRLVMGDPKAERIVEVVRQNGTVVNLTPSTYHGVNAIAALETLYDIDGQGIWLAKTLRFLREAFGDDMMSPTTCSVSMLKATCWFIDKHIESREVRWEEMVERVGAAGADDIRRKAMSHKAANGGSQWVNTYRAMVELWNFRRKDSSKIMWKTRGSIANLGDQSSNKDHIKKVRARQNG